MALGLAVVLLVVGGREHPGSAVAPAVVVERDPAERLAAGLGLVGEAAVLGHGDGLSLVGREQTLRGGVIPRCRLRGLAMVEVGRFG